ncbi:uncharacterized protein G2W53_017462 [Senna tora]|uniref:Uncharacterized protein n=1 Tax=Senna tora TaxID=362788 RepID=A0A834TQ06_9FABA|nr:uncharacterized protein G2W53_017462 [Senna tora]
MALNRRQHGGEERKMHGSSERQPRTNGLLAGGYAKIFAKRRR